MRRSERAVIDDDDVSAYVSTDFELLNGDSSKLGRIREN